MNGKIWALISLFILGGLAIAGVARAAVLPTTPVPYAPQNGSVVSTSPVMLGWQLSVASGETVKYEIALRKGSEAWQTKSSASTTLSLSGLADENYTWKVRAIGNKSNTASAWSAESVFTIDRAAPSVPANLRLNLVSDGVIKLSWNASAGTAKYIVYRNGGELASTTSTSYTDNRAHAEDKYQVAARDATGNTSGKSATVSAPALESPPAAKATESGASNPLADALGSGTSNSNSDSGEVAGTTDIASLLGGGATPTSVPTSEEPLNPAESPAESPAPLAGPVGIPDENVSAEITPAFAPGAESTLPKPPIWLVWWFWLIIGVAAVGVTFLIWYIQDRKESRLEITSEPTTEEPKPQEKSDEKRPSIAVYGIKEDRQPIPSREPEKKVGAPQNLPVVENEDVGSYDPEDVLTTEPEEKDVKEMVGEMNEIASEEARIVDQADGKK